MTPVRAAVAFGSNLGDRRGNVERALEQLAATPGVKLLRRSSIRETDPVGGPPQGRFLNGVVLIETTLAPRALLDALLEIERAGGRTRGERNAPRTLDLDLVFHGDAIVSEPGLELPHPRAHERRFVLEPLAEVAPDWVHPRLRRSTTELLAEVARRETRDSREPAAPHDREASCG